MKRLFFLILLVVLIVPGCGVFKKQAPATLTPSENERMNQLLGTLGPPVDIDVNTLPEITVDTLRLAFDENPLNAQLAYDKKWLKVRGDIVAGPVKVEAKGVYGYSLTLAYNDKKILCFFFGPEKEQQLAQLKNGQPLVVVGRYFSSTAGPSLVFCSINDE